MPWSIVAATLGLMLIGLAAIDRADGSPFQASSVSHPPSAVSHWESEANTAGWSPYVRRQVVWVVLGVVVMAAAAAVSYRVLERWAYGLYAVSLGLLAIVYLFPPVNGAHRWMRLGPVSVQPSELAKLALVAALARWLMYRENFRRLPGLVAPLLMALVPMALILKEPDLGTAMLIPPVLFAVLFAAGARLRHFALIGLLGAATLPWFWLQMNGEQRSRITSLFAQRGAEGDSPLDGGGLAPSEGPPRGAGYQLYMSKQVIALGGLWGSFWQGQTVENPAAYRLPEARTDFIFSVVGERWGVAGCTVVVVLYVVIFARGLAVAARAREPFGKLLAAGIVAMLAIQALVNMAMTVGLMPITGLTLPLVSYGGSSLLVTAASMGLLVSVGLRPGFEIAPAPFRFRG